MKSSDKRLNDKGYVHFGRIGCNGTRKYIAPAFDSAVVIRYLSWQCTLTKEQYKLCRRENDCPNGGVDIFFANGRFPNGDELTTTETLRFYIKDPTLDAGYGTLKDAEDMAEFFYGTREGDGRKHLNCEATLTESYPKREIFDEDLRRLAYLYSQTPYSVSLSTIEDLKFEWSYTIDEKALNKRTAGTIIKVLFDFSKVPRSRFFQYGVRFYHHELYKKVRGEIKEIGCDSRGLIFHSNANDYAAIAQVNQKDPSSMYYVDQRSRCSEFDVHFEATSLLVINLRAFPENSGYLIPFVRDFATGVYDLGSETLMSVFREAKWLSWSQWTSCGRDCSGSLDRSRTRSRTCQIPILEPFYLLEEDFNRVENCTRLDGQTNHLTDEHIGLCWGDGRCITSDVGVKLGSSAFAEFDGTKVDLLKKTDNVDPSSAFTIYELHSNLERVTEEKRLKPLQKDNMKIHPDTLPPTAQIVRVPGNVSVQLAIKNNSTGYIEWTLDLDKAGLPSSYAIGNVSLYKSQLAAKECWVKHMSPCLIDIFETSALATVIELKASNSSGNNWIRPYANFNPRYYQEVVKYRKSILKLWKLTNDGRNATVRMEIPKLTNPYMGLYQPKAALINTDNPSKNGWVTLSPLVDLKVDVGEITSTSRHIRDRYTEPMAYINLTYNTDETYPLMISVARQSFWGYKSYGFLVNFYNALEIPEIASAEISVGCSRVEEDIIQVRFFTEDDLSDKRTWAEINFEALKMVVGFTADQSGDFLLERMRDYDVYVHRFNLRQRGTVYKHFQARRLIELYNNSAPRDPNHYRPWPQESHFNNVTKEELHDLYHCNRGPVDGGWSHFTLVGKNGTCGLVKHYWSRECNTPYPFKGGADCIGKPVVPSLDYLGRCLTVGVWMDWGEWSTCELGCGSCTIIRTRECEAGDVCEISGKLSNRKSVETTAIMLNGSCDGDCRADSDCRGMAAPAVCEGDPRRCAFLCQDSMHCSNGICTELRRWNGDSVSVCIDQCAQQIDCSASEMCVARRCLKTCEANANCTGHNDICSINGYCTKACSNRFSCQTQLGPRGNCYALGQLSNQRECVVGCKNDRGCFNKDFECILGMCIAKAYTNDYDNILCSNRTYCPLNAVCDLNAGKCMNPINESFVCGKQQNCGLAARCSCTDCDDGRCTSIVNIHKPCTEDTDCGYLENCEFGVCVLQQDNNGLVATATDGCSNCNTRIADSVCMNDKCQCAEGMNMYGGVRCGNVDGANATSVGQMVKFHACEGESKSVTCLPQQRIQIKGASIIYGLTTQSPCGDPASKDCLADIDKTRDNVLSICQGEESCTITASDDEYNLDTANICTEPVNSVLQFDFSCESDSIYRCIEGVCLLKCSSKSDCPFNHFCHNSLCRKSCVEGAIGSQLSCSNRQVCEDNLCKKVCISLDSECFAAQKCISGQCYDLCYRDRSCPRGFICSGGICKLSCQETGECKDAEMCNGGACYATCTSQAECDSHQKCYLGLCSAACKIERDCPGELSCVGGACTSHCIDDSGCSESICAEGFCSVPSCVDSQVCGDGKWTCQENKCLLGCDANTNCHTSQRCVNNICKTLVGAACEDDQKCNSDSLYLTNICNNNICEVYFKPGLRCRRSSQCGPHAICKAGVCTWPTDINGIRLPTPASIDCSSNDNNCSRVLVGGVCVDSTVCGCAVGYQQLHGHCVPEIMSCFSLADCPANQICQDGTCHSLCKSEADCENGLVCLHGGVCGFSCSSRYGCPSGTRCFRDGCEKQCQSGDGIGIVCADTLQTCADGICRISTTDPTECVEGTLLRSGICVAVCSADSECLDICVVGTCSSSCSAIRLCPSGYTCMSGRCFAECDMAEENICGDDERHQCLIGLSASQIGTGICVYQTEYPPTSDKDYDILISAIGCDLYTGTFKPNCGPDGGNGKDKPDGPGFFVDDTLAISCRSDTDCGLDVLQCIGGFCTTLCDSARDDECRPHSICVTWEEGSPEACLIRCENSTVNCPPMTNCGSRDGEKICISLLYKECSEQVDCLDSAGNYLYCDQIGGICIPYENEGEPCIYQSHCGLGTYCSAARVCTRYAFILPIDNSKCSGKGITGLIYDTTSQKCMCPSGFTLYGNRCFDLRGLETGFLDVCSSDSECPDLGVCVASRCLRKCYSHCSAGYECVQGVCQPICKSDDECPDGVNCYLGSCTPVCTDNARTDVCGSIGKCVGGVCYEHPISDPAKCTTNELVYFKADEICLANCTVDGDCQNSACVTGVCSTTCTRANPYCPENRECVSGECQLRCHPDRDDCPQNDYNCINRLCSQKCQKETDCNGFATCVNGNCVNQCETDHDCHHYLSACHQGICAHKCTADDVCPLGYKCDTVGVYKCAVICQNDDPCSVYQTCDTQSQICVTLKGKQCTDHSDCERPRLLYCSPLTDTCESIDKEGAPCHRQNCGLNEVCTSERMCRLREDWNGNPTTHPDIISSIDVFEKKSPPNELCSLNSECRDKDDVCISNHCYSLAEKNEPFGGCAVDNPLPQRLVSSDGLQMLTCEASSDCDSNQLCVDCVCAAKCKGDIDCTDFQKCFLGLCMETCSEDGGCNSMTDICVDGLCRDQCEDGSSDKLAYGSCSGGVINPQCHSGAPCPRGYVCEKFVCEKLCNDVDDCSSRQICGLSTCTTSCSNKNTRNCVNGTILNTCYSNLDCGPNRFCILGVCSPKCSCTKDGDCYVAPCKTIGWDCDQVSGGCISGEKEEEKTTAVETIGLGCQQARDCKHYNLYCNLDTNKCVPVRPVAGVATCNEQTDTSFCGVNGECINGRCDCIRNGAGKCIGSPPQPCKKDLSSSTCSRGQVCDPTYAWCTCPNNAVILGNDCVDVVQAVGETDYYLQACVINSQCPTSSSCVSGNCYPHCTTDCSRFPGMTCHAGVCMLKCHVTSDCDVNQYCRESLDPLNNFRVCVLKCSQGSSNQCAKDQYCVSGECQLSCLSGNTCEGETTCVDHLCVPSCVFDFDCAELCVHGLCGTSCESHNDCGKGGSCQKGRCIQRCRNDDNCASAQVCVQGYCTRDCPTIEYGCRDVCSNTTQCARGLSCTEGLCSAPCYRSADCGKDHICSEGSCVVSCSGQANEADDTAVCPSHLFCDFESGYCKSPTGTSCTSSSDCDLGYFCSGQLCRDGTHLGSKCKTDQDCGIEELCVLGVCECLRAYDGECVEYPLTCVSINAEISGQSHCDSRLPQSTCDPHSNWCLCENPYQRHGDRCVNPASELCIEGCPFGFECRGYKCYQKCDGNVRNCPLGLTCVNGYCDYSCEHDSNCNNGQKCECGFCVHVCTDNSQCLSGQRCNEGACREECAQQEELTESETCTPKTDTACSTDAQCANGQRCIESFCFRGCGLSEAMYKCATSGFRCQKGLCLKECTQTVACSVLPGEVDTECGCPTAKATEFDDCLLYDVFCPKTTYQPDGYTLGKVSEAINCSDLIAGSDCAEDGSTCVCKQGQVQYAGAVCQQLLKGCSATDGCPEDHTCISGHCYKKCTDSADCTVFTFCNTNSGLCHLICDNSTDCLGHQRCNKDIGDGVCVTADKAKGPECDAPSILATTENGGGVCQVPESESCIDGHCECIMGMRRSVTTGRCEWLVDIVCLKCPPCLEKCADKNMECNAETRLCMCVEGFKLDESGRRCNKDDFTVTEFDCDSDADCNLLPNSYCNGRFGKCQCDRSYCYKERFCQPDLNECSDTVCQNKTTCVNLNCLEPPGTCISDILTAVTASTNKRCDRLEECAEFGPNTYCFSGRCTCVTGSFLINYQCTSITFCNEVLDCELGMTCEFGICSGTRTALASSSFDEAPAKKVNVDWVAVIIGCLMTIGIAATIIVAIYTKREYDQKNATMFDDKEIKSKVEFRRASIAGKKDVLEKKLSTAQTAEVFDPIPPPEETLPTEDQAVEDENITPVNQPDKVIEEVKPKKSLKKQKSTKSRTSKDSNSPNKNTAAAGEAGSGSGTRSDSINKPSVKTSLGNQQNDFESSKSKNTNYSEAESHT